MKFANRDFFSKCDQIRSFLSDALVKREFNHNINNIIILFLEFRLIPYIKSVSIYS